MQAGLVNNFAARYTDPTMAKAKNPSQDKRKNNGGARPKTRPDDRRGSPKGSFEQPPFEPTEPQRERVKQLSRSCTDDQIAIMEEISVSTLQRHFKRELEIGRAETTALIGSKLIDSALRGCKARQMFYLRTKGGWNQTLEHTGQGGGPIRTFDLSKYSVEELKTIRPLIQQMIADGREIDQDEIDTALDA